MKSKNTFRTILMSLLCLFFMGTMDAQETIMIKDLDKVEEEKVLKKRAEIKKLANPAPGARQAEDTSNKSKPSSNTLTSDDIHSIQIRIDAKKAALAAEKSKMDKEEYRAAEKAILEAEKRLQTRQSASKSANADKAN